MTAIEAMTMMREGWVLRDVKDDVLFRYDRGDVIVDDCADGESAFITPHVFLVRYAGREFVLEKSGK